MRLWGAAPASVCVLYLFYELNRVVWPNKANSSELPGFLCLSTDFSPTVLILPVDFKRSVEIAAATLPTRDDGKQNRRGYFATFP